MSASLAIHAIAVGALMLARPDLRLTTEPPPNGYGSARVFAVHVESPSDPGDHLLAEDTAPSDAGRDVTDTNDLAVSGFEFDTATIRARRHWLFPFVTTDFLFLERDQGADGRVADGPMISPFAAAAQMSSRPRLSIDAATVQSIVDHAWSRRERWPRFAEIQAFVSAHHPNEGMVPVLLQTYLEQNLLQPYFDADTRDPRFWAMLSCVADHVEFVDWVRSFAREHPSSRATTELLFLIDELAQGSRDTLLMLLATRPDADLQDTRNRDPQAYELAVSVRRHYEMALASRDLVASSAIRQHYDAVRLRILSRILRTTPNGYRSSDARFLAGEILFNRNDLAGAIRHWREMQPVPGDTYALAATEILAEFRSPGGPNAARINSVLGAEYRRWLDFSRARLQQFGFAFDSF